MVGVGDVAGDAVDGGAARGRRAGGSSSRASVTTIQPASSRERARARPRPEDPPVMRAVGGVSFGSHEPSVKVQVNLSSRGGDGFARAALRGRGRQAQWVRRVGAALLRGRGTDLGHPHVGRPAPVRAQRAAPAGLHPGRLQHRAHPRRGPRGARPAAGRPGADQGGLATDHAALARPARRPDRRPGAAARRARLVHRLRLPVPPALPDDEPRRLDGDDRRRPRRREPAGAAAPAAPVPVSGPETR